MDNNIITMPKFAINSDKKEITVSLTGDLQGDIAALLRETLLSYIDKGYLHFIVNLTAVNSINSTGLGVLVNIQKHVKQNDGNIKIIGVNGRVKTAFLRTRLNKAFCIQEEAV